MTIKAFLLATLLPTYAFAGTCGNLTPDAQRSLEKAKTYYEKNKSFIEQSRYMRGSGDTGKKIVINDYCGKPAKMFVFDSQTGQCQQEMEVGFGNGAGGKLEPGCGPEEHLTPPGFHITTEAAGGSKYPYPEGIGMVSCEGQTSLKRGIKIHAAANPPTGENGSSWGCSTLSKDDYEYFKKEVRGGSLVYNAFCEDQEKNAKGCERPAGVDEATCTPEQGEGGGGSSSGGGKSGGASGGTKQTR